MEITPTEQRAVGLNIKLLMKERNMTAKMLASDLAVSAAFISGVINCTKKMPVKMYQRILEYFHTTHEELSKFKERSIYDKVEYQAVESVELKLIADLMPSLSKIQKRDLVSYALSLINNSEKPHTSHNTRKIEIHSKTFGKHNLDKVLETVQDQQEESDF